MGCYDTLNVSRLTFKLPRPDCQMFDISGIDFNDLQYQTKDLGRGMGCFKFLEDRRLYEFVPIRHDTKKESSQYDSCAITEKWVFRDDVTDYIVFYDYIQNNNSPYDFAIDYRAHVVNGVLSTVEILKWEVLPNDNRKANIDELRNDLLKLEEWNKRWYVKFLYWPYVRGVRTLFRWWRQVTEHIPSSQALEFLLVDPKRELARQIRIRKRGKP